MMVVVLFNIYFTCHNCRENKRESKMTTQYNQPIPRLNEDEQKAITQAFLELPFTKVEFDDDEIQFVEEIKKQMQSRMTRNEEGHICHPFLVWKNNTPGTLRMSELLTKYVKVLNIKRRRALADMYEDIRGIFHRTLLYVLEDAEKEVDVDSLPIRNHIQYDIKEEDYIYVKEKLEYSMDMVNPLNAIVLEGFLEEEEILIPDEWKKDPLNHYNELAFLYFALSKTEEEVKKRKKMVSQPSFGRLYKVIFQMASKGDAVRAYRLLNENVSKIVGKDVEFCFTEYMEKTFKCDGSVSLDTIDISDVTVSGKKGQVKSSFHQILKDDSSYVFQGNYTVWNNDFMVLVQLNPYLDVSEYVYYVIPTKLICNEDGKVKNTLNPEQLDEYLSVDSQAKFYTYLFQIQKP